MTGESDPRAPPAAIAHARRGHLKVFLGMAAGVGKTYYMLLEGRAELQAGRDVVIGLLETHGRAETARLAEGLSVVPRLRVRYRETEELARDLEIVPRRRIIYRDRPVEEMDLPAILAPFIGIKLIDLLVHNVLGA